MIIIVICSIKDVVLSQQLLRNQQHYRDSSGNVCKSSAFMPLSAILLPPFYVISAFSIDVKHNHLPKLVDPCFCMLGSRNYVGIY